MPEDQHPPRQGSWMPQSHDTHQKWLQKTIEHVESNPKDLHPVIEDFKHGVESNTRLTMLFTSMFEQVPHKSPYQKDPPQVRDINQLCALLNHIIFTAPSWTDVGEEMGLVGVPINAILDWPMGTRSGFAVFQDPEVNKHIERILDTWGEYLQSPASASVLGTDPNGWFGEHALTELEKTANVGQTPRKTFEELFECDSQAEHYGYASWDAFFTRHFRFSDGIRPVASPDNDDVVVQPCESKTYKVARDVVARAKFWVKGQPYSVLDMLAHDELAPQFVGGTIYQAFLSSLSYHRWHAPVSGTIKKAFVVPGTYFSEPLFEDFASDHHADENTESTSQEYLSAVATRAIILIEANSPKVGLMAFLGIGMTEVSTCDITVKEGQHIKKGDEIGMFHFGGSTQCCVFRKGVKLEGFPEPGHPFNHPVRAELARVV